MSYTEEHTQTFHYFSDEEHKMIEKKLEDMGHTFDTNIVCGDCCGMYADEYWVNGIGGEWSSQDQLAMIQFMEEKGISGSVGANTISADPEEFNN